MLREIAQQDTRGTREVEFTNLHPTPDLSRNIVSHTHTGQVSIRLRRSLTAVSIR